MSESNELLLPFGNEKALREQGPKLPTTPTKVLEEVIGDYQRFDEVAIDCTQYFEGQTIKALLRSKKSRDSSGIDVRISGRGGLANCHVKRAEHRDFIERLIKQYNDLYGKNSLGVIE